VQNCLKIGSGVPELEDPKMAFPIETVHRPYNSTVAQPVIMIINLPYY